jgi:hexosaminidase
MPEDAYQAYVRKLLPAVRDLAKRPVGWQELVRAGADAVQAIQYWMSPASFQAFAEPELPSEAAAMVADNVARSRADVERALRHGVKVIMSPVAHCYLDVPYAEQSADPAQAHRRERVGLRNYRPLTLRESFSWEPVAALGARASAQDVAGVEAVMWCETVRDFDDLTFALLPRLPGIAEKAWGMAASWADHSDALGAHRRVWHQDGLTFFRAPSVGWT